MKKNLKRFFAYLLTVAILTGSLTACGANTTSTEKTSEKATQKVTEKGTDVQTEVKSGITVTDQIGRSVSLDAPAKKIVSSYYISTAITVALGLEDKLCGIEMKADTRELYKKAAPGLLDLPAVGSGKGINVEETAALSPDVVILPKKLKDSVEQFEKLGIPVIVVDPETLENYMDCVTLLGEVTGTKDRAESLNQYYKDKMDEVTQLTKDLKEKPSVYLAAGSGYLSTCTSNMYQNDLIEMAGGQNVSAGLTDSYWAEISKEQLLQWNPEYVLAVSYAEYSLTDITSDAGLLNVSAVENERVYTFPSAIEPWDYPTPSSVLGILWLTQLLHPDLYTKEAYVKEAKEFYQTYFDIQVEEEELGL